MNAKNNLVQIKSVNLLLFYLALIFGFSFSSSFAELVRIPAIQDTTIQDEPHVEANYGSSAGLMLGTYNQNDQECRMLMQFDTSNVTGKVNKATLNLYRYYKYKSNELYADVYRVVTPWDELQVTWKNTDGGNLHDSNQITTTLLPGEGAGDQYNKPWERWDNRWYQWDLTELVQNWVDNPSSNHGIIIKTDELYGTMSAFRGSSSSENAPYLEVEFDKDASPAPVLEVNFNGDEVSCSWSDVSSAKKYIFYYAPYPSMEYVGEIEMGSSRTISAKLGDNAAYYVAVGAVDSSGQISLSNIEYFELGKSAQSYAGLCITPVTSFNDLFSNLVLFSDVEHDIYADLLLMFSENGTKPLFDSTVTLGENDPTLRNKNYEKITRIGQVYDQLGPCFNASMAYLNNGSSTHRGIVGSAYNFFIGYIGGNTGRAKDRIKNIVNKGDDEVKQEVYEAAKNRWPNTDFGDSPDEFMEKLDEGDFNDKVHQLHNDLCNDPFTTYSEIAIDNDQRPIDVAKEEGLNGIKTGTDFYIDSTKSIIGGLPNGEKFGEGFDKAKNTVDKISAYEKGGIKDFLKKDAEIDIEDNVKSYLDSHGVSNDTYDAIKDSASIIGKSIIKYFKHTSKSHADEGTYDDELSDWDWGTISFDTDLFGDDLDNLFVSWEDDDGELESLLVSLVDNLDTINIDLPADEGDKEITGTDHKGEVSKVSNITVKSGETTVVQSSDITACGGGEKLDNGSCVAMTCKDDGYQCPECSSDETLEYGNDGSGVCVTKQVSGTSFCAIEKADNEDSNFWLYPSSNVKVGCSYHSGSNQLQCETPYTDDKMDGLQVCYYSDGTMLSEIPYTEGSKDGIYKKYYANGYLEREVPYQDGDKNVNGSYKTYYESNGNLSLEIPYDENGEIDGFEKKYYENGNISSITPYENGTPNYNGTNKTYWENGQIHTSTPYVNGEYHGTLTSFYENGNPYFKHEYNNGIKDGKSLIYFDNNQLSVDSTYVNGKLHGKDIEYYKDGSIKSCSIYNMGVYETACE